MVSPLTDSVVSVKAVAVEQFAVEDDVRPAVGGDALQCGVQVDGLGGECRDAFVAVSVRGGPGDPESSTEQSQVLGFAEPDENEKCLVEAG